MSAGSLFNDLRRLELIQPNPLIMEYDRLFLYVTDQEMHNYLVNDLIAGLLFAWLYPAQKIFISRMCGGIKFSVANEGIDKITIKANGDDVISGSLALSTSLDVIKGTSWGNSNPSASLVITAPDGGTFHPGSYYYAVIPASEYTNGFTISYHKGNVAASFVDNNDITIKRSTFKRLYNKDADLQFKPVYDAKALFPSNNILPDGVDKTTITEAHFHVNSDKVTDTVISEGTDDYKAVYTQITFYYETQVISHSGNFLSFWCNCLQPGEG